MSEITIQDLKNINQNDIVAVWVAEIGACGRSGEIGIFTKNNTNINEYVLDYQLELDFDNVKKFNGDRLTIDMSCPSYRTFMIAYWPYIHTNMHEYFLGLGSHIFVLNSMFKYFSSRINAARSENIPFDCKKIIQDYLDLAPNFTDNTNQDV